MSLKIQVPQDVDPEDLVGYFVSFESFFLNNEGMRNALLGVKDNLRQAALLLDEPLGMLACLTAEEEAATFLYYALQGKEYCVPEYGKLRRHPDKLKLVVFAIVTQRYFFSRMPSELSSVISVERDGQRPITCYKFYINGFECVQDDPLETVVTSGEEEGSHDHAVEASVTEVLADITRKGYTVNSYIKYLANRRNLCLYGDPTKKIRLQSTEELEHFKSNCISMIVLGLLVYNGNYPTPSMLKLVKSIFDKIRE